MLSIKYQVSSIKYQVSSIKIFLKSPFTKTKRLVSEYLCLMPIFIHLLSYLPDLQGKLSTLDSLP